MERALVVRDLGEAITQEGVLAGHGVTPTRGPEVTMSEAEGLGPSWLNNEGFRKEEKKVEVGS